MLWLRNKDLGEKIGVENIYDLIDKEIKNRFETKNQINEQIKEYKKLGSELIDGEKFMLTRKDFIIPIIMHYRVSIAEATEFKTRLGFNQHDLIMTKKQSVLTKIMKVFLSEEILLKHSVLRYQGQRQRGWGVLGGCHGSLTFFLTKKLKLKNRFYLKKTKKNKESYHKDKILHW